MALTGMLLGAGLGTRMAPLTNDRPKPLISVGGRTMLDRALDHFAAADVERVVVNVHYRAEQIIQHLSARTAPPQTRISDETDLLLETGGGIQKALPLLGASPFLASNGDAVWTDGPDGSVFRRLAEVFDPERMDGLLLLVGRQDALGYHGVGDFFQEPDGRLVRRGTAPEAPWLYGGIQILHPRVFDDIAPGVFSLNRIYDRLLAKGRLHGLVHGGRWAHVGTPSDITPAEAMLAAETGAMP